MSLLTKRFYQRTAFLAQNSYVETGTYKGENLEAIIDSSLFENIYSLELDAKWYEYNKNRFSDKGNVHFNHGDSAELLPLVLEKKNRILHNFSRRPLFGPRYSYGKRRVPSTFRTSYSVTSKFD